MLFRYAQIALGEMSQQDAGGFNLGGNGNGFGNGGVFLLLSLILISIRKRGFVNQQKLFVERDLLATSSNQGRARSSVARKAQPRSRILQPQQKTIRGAAIVIDLDILKVGPRS